MAYVDVLTALADPTRRTVFERLRDGALPVGEIARDLPVSRPAVSQHLRVLRDAGLVTERPQGTRHFYAISKQGLAELRDYLAAFSERVATPARGRRQSKPAGPDAAVRVKRAPTPKSAERSKAADKAKSARSKPSSEVQAKAKAVASPEIAMKGDGEPAGAREPKGKGKGKGKGKRHGK